MALQHNQEWDAAGNLIRDEWVEVPDQPKIDPAVVDFVATLSPEQQLALKQALGL